MTKTKDGNDKAFFLGEGLKCLDMKCPLAAISAFEKALQLDPSSAGAHSGIGQAFLDMEEFHRAKAAFSKSVQLAPTADRYVLLGYTLRQLGHDRIAFRAYKSALRMSPDNDEALFNIGIMLKDRHPKFATAFLAKAVETNPAFAACYRELGALLNRAGRFQEAKGLLEKAINLKSGDVWIWIELANALWRTNEQDRSEDILETAARKFPTAAVPLWTLASYLETSGRMLDAERLFKQAADRDPADGVAQKMLANFLDRSRRKVSGC